MIWIFGQHFIITIFQRNIIIKVDLSSMLFVHFNMEKQEWNEEIWGDFNSSHGR